MKATGSFELEAKIICSTFFSSFFQLNFCCCSLIMLVETSRLVREFSRLLLLFLPLSTASSTHDVHRDPLIRLCRFLTRPTGLLIGGCRVSATALPLSRCFSFNTLQFFVLAFSCGSRVYPPPMFSLLRCTLHLTFLARRSTIASAMSEKPRSRTRGPPACV